MWKISFHRGVKIVPPWWKISGWNNIFSMEERFIHQASFSLIIGRTRNAIYTEKVKTEVNKRGFFFLLKLPVIRFLLLFLHFVIFSTVMKTESTTYNLLNSISYPEDLRKLSVEQLPEICKELRQDIIQELLAIRDTLPQAWALLN